MKEYELRVSDEQRGLCYLTQRNCLAHSVALTVSQHSVGYYAVYSVHDSVHDSVACGVCERMGCVG